jgi:hypothetical protein
MGGSGRTYQEDVEEESPADSVERATLNELLSGRKAASQGKRVRLDDVFFIGTHVERVKGGIRDGSFIHVSLKEHGVLKPVCVNNGKIEKPSGFLLLIDPAVGGSIGQLCSEFGFNSMDKPSYYAELEVTPKGDTILITAMEVLLLNTIAIAKGQFRESFLVYHVDQSGARQWRNVDDDYWFKKLGDQGLVAEWRNRFNKLATRLRNDADFAANEKMLAKGLSATAQAKAAGDFQMQAFARSKGF